MALPSLVQERLGAQSYITLCQKQVHKGAIFSALHRGNSTVALDDKFALKFTKVSNDHVIVDLIRYGIDARTYTNINFAPRKPKATKKPKASHKPSIKFKKAEGVEEL